MAQGRRRGGGNYGGGSNWQQTMVSLPPDMAARLDQIAAASGQSKAGIMRQALKTMLAESDSGESHWDHLIDEYIVEFAEELNEVREAQPFVLVMAPSIEGLGQHRRSNVDRWHNYYQETGKDPWQEVEQKFQHRTRVKLGVILAGRFYRNDSFEMREPWQAGFEEFDPAVIIVKEETES